ncbi:tonoplast intrinsic protein 4;1 [Actinidia rufa]|uniref:Tonoplast intrinsic protein 41 n=1 Tax=Actinidia rufa TaxID=165716 RepID=A0A7J0GZJ2_9ERIC|nr:tonoplast intrinsic protein 4;1 [Actinidia rufa]
MASALLEIKVDKYGTPVHTLAVGMGYLQGVIMEIVLTFSLLFTVYTTIVDPKKGFLDGLGPLPSWARSWGQHHGWWGLLGDLHEPGKVLWAGHGEWGLEPITGSTGLGRLLVVGFTGLFYKNCFIVRSHVPFAKRRGDFPSLEAKVYVFVVTCDTLCVIM